MLSQVTKDNDVPMTASSSSSTCNISAEQLQRQEGGVDDRDLEQKETDDAELCVNAWKRDPERERDKIQGFFVIAGQPIPRDIFHSIMLFIPAFPYYFMLRSVCSQWLYEFQEQIYGNVTYLSLVDDGKPKYYIRKCGDGQDQLVAFKPIDSTGKTCQLSGPSHYTRKYNRIPIFEFLANVFPNVKRLRLTTGSFSTNSNLNTCLNTLLPRFTQLETFDLLGTNLRFKKSRYGGYSISMTELEMDTLARSLPSSTKNLNFIGVSFEYGRAVEMLTIFSDKGRLGIDMSYHQYSLQGYRKPINVNIQSLTLPLLILNPNQPNVDWESIKEMYSHFEVSLIESTANLSVQNVPVVSHVKYLDHMSKKEGICLSYMGNTVRTEANDVVEAIIIAVREYSYFQPLLSLPVSPTIAVLLAPYTKLDANFVLNNVNSALQILELLTNPDRMKYPELVMNINSTFDWFGCRCTLLSILIRQCTNEESLTLIKTLVEDYKPSLIVNGVRNYLLELMVSGLPNVIRTKLMEYLLSIGPELIVLGNTEGIIDGGQRNLPLIQLALARHDIAESLEDIRQLVTAGASLTQVDKDGNNILHSACKYGQIDTVLDYLLSVCPENLMLERNNKGQTPIEQIFPPNRFLKYPDTNVQIKFLNDVAKLPFFKSQTLKGYKTSCGNLLHVAMACPNVQIIQWLLEKGFDANELNERGENALFYCKAGTASWFYNVVCASRPIINQEDYVDDNAAELIKAGAKVDLENNEGDTIVTSALRNKNYALINIIIHKPSISPKPLSTLLVPRMQHGFNALHYIVKKMVDVTDSLTSMSKKQKAFLLGDYPVAKHCALICLEDYPEMLFERSEPSKDEEMKDVSGRSPLQILLEASNGLFLLNELSINLSDIANRPVYSNKDSDVVAPIPVLYLALEVSIDVPMFDKLMNCTNNLLVRDEAQETKPNLLHISAERDASLCQCIIKHWKKKFSNKEELSKLISMPLENDEIDGRKPRNAALIACYEGNYEIFSILWPYTKTFAAQLDSPVRIALEKKYYSFALSVVIHHGVVPSKTQLHQSLRHCLRQHHVDTVHESKFVSLMIQTEDDQSKPSWLEMLTQKTSEAVDSEEERNVKSLSTFQLIVSEAASYIFSWLVRRYSDDPLLDCTLRAVDTRTGNTLLHLMTSGVHRGFVGNELASILQSIVDRFKVKGAAPQQEKRSKTKLPSLDHLNTQELTEFINIKNKIGRTCLHNVAANSLQPVLHDLLVYGSNLEIEDTGGKTPFDLMTGNDSATFIVQKFLTMRDGKKPEKKRKVTKKEEVEKEGSDDKKYASSRRRKRARK